MRRDEEERSGDGDKEGTDQHGIVHSCHEVIIEPIRTQSSVTMIR